MRKTFQKGKSLLCLSMALMLLFNVILFSESVYASDVTIPTPVIANISVGNSSFAHSDNDNELRIELEETNDDYAIQYEVLYGTSNNPTTQMEIVEIEKVGTTTGGTSAYLVSNDTLTSGNTYYFKVRRCHGSIKSEWSDIFICSFVQVGKPVIKSVNVQYKQVYISYPYDYYNVPYLYASWNTVTNAEKYIVEIQRYDETRDTYIQCGYEYAISNTYCKIQNYDIDSSFKPNEKLYISVKAYSETKSSYSEASEKYEITMPNIVLNKIEFDNYNLSLKVGDKQYIEKTLSPYNATNRAVLWTSSNTDVATVSSYGQVTAVSEGRTIVTCSGLYGDAFAVCEVIVTANENSDETSSVVSTGSGKCGDNATWVLDENGVLTINGTGAIWDLNVYNSSDKSLYVNYRKYIKKLVIEEGITEIGDGSFSNFSNVTDVTLPNSLESMGEGCFYGGGFTDITIPKNVKTIKPRAFMYCNNLLSINVASGNNCYLSIDGVLFDASTLTLVSYPKNKQNSNYSVPNGIEHIEYCAFHSVMSLKSVTLPNSIKTIGEVAFGYCKNLTECNIPNGVYNIAASAFNSTGLTELVLPSSLETLTTNSFYGCSKLDYIVIPKSIINIDAVVFQKCDNITHINYEGSQSEWNEIVIGANNDPLTNATINFNSTHVHSGGSATCSARAICEECGNEYGAFAHSLSYYDYKSATCKEVGWQAYEKCSYCSYSTYIEIPLSSHEIGKYGAYPATCEAEGNITYYKCSVCEQFFSDSNGENTISQADTITSPLGHSYNENTGLCTNCDKVKAGYCGANITWELNENGVLTINGTGEMWKNFSWEPTEIKEVIIHNGVTNISAEAFRGCTNLTSISIPDSVVTIGAKAFYGTPLKSITIPNSVETLEKNALYGCNSLEELTIPFIGGSQTSNAILGYLFDSSTTSYRDSYSGAILYKTTYHIPSTLKKLTITNETAITSSSFKNCSNIEAIVLPSTLTSINSSAFEDCTKLTDIYFTGTNIEWENLFQGEITATVHFTDVTATSITLAKSEISLLEGETETLTATILPSNTTNKNVIWTSSNENVATVSNGVITAQKVGTTTITATSGDGKQTATCVVTVDYKVKISVFDCQVIGMYVLIDIAVENMTDTHTLYFATYDESGRLLEIQTPNLTDGSTRIILPLGTIHKIKAFVWEDNLQIITRHVEKIIEYLEYSYIVTDGNVTITGYTGDGGNVTIPSTIDGYPVTVIEDYAFAGCTSLTSIIIPDSITNIENYTFGNCTSLTSVTMPDAVTSVGNYAFSGCTSLTDVYYASTEEQWNAIAIDDGNECLTNATIHYLGKIADYSAVEAAIAKVPADLTIYTTETAQALTDAVNAVVYDLTVKEQAIVDAYAVAIEDAVSNLQYKPADYTAVETALAKVPDDLSKYTDETAQTVTDAVNAVVYDLAADQQATVDGYATAIEDALSKLELKSTAGGSAIELTDALVNYRLRCTTAVVDDNLVLTADPEGAPSMKVRLGNLPEGAEIMFTQSNANASMENGIITVKNPGLGKVNVPMMIISEEGLVTDFVLVGDFGNAIRYATNARISQNGNDVTVTSGNASAYLLFDTTDIDGGYVEVINVSRNLLGRNVIVGTSAVRFYNPSYDEGTATVNVKNADGEIVESYNVTMKFSSATEYTPILESSLRCSYTVDGDTITVTADAGATNVYLILGKYYAESLSASVNDATVKKTGARTWRVMKSNTPIEFDVYFDATQYGAEVVTRHIIVNF